MTFSPQIYSTLYSMAPLGGLFVGTVGVFLILGALLPAIRMRLTYVGFAAATLALVFGGRLAVGLPAPSHLQVIFLILAIVLEVALFIILMPRVRRRGDRAVLIATLAIVGVHFLVMLPALGPVIGILGVLCLMNSGIAWRNVFYPIEAAWILDGAMKIAAGVLLIMTSPMFA